MPLVRRDPEAREKAPGATAPDETGALLRSPDPAQRRHAARALTTCPGAVPALVQALGVEGDAAVREAILAALSDIGDEAAALALISALRSEDAGLRNGALEALRSMPEAAAAHLPALLADGDSDVRILAAEIARGLSPAVATALLCAMLDSETHPNACGAALDVLTEVGTTDALPTLRRIAERFAGDPFVPFAVQVAMARIEGHRDGDGLL
ncbi:HEAT repeat domain-containing protein [Arenibaculum pallidiluteum]|uniref:HEAT repeat domain-containing protein n=1 Tax=Arenibaculum pallidiluteum TaxID=2812559 RepID=UPI001A9613E0|nr:HEAT repeat domain-containing protein [Arenibaculum pallidiluteum]